MTSITCPVSGCHRKVQPGRVVCNPHWHMASRSMQKAFYRAVGKSDGTLTAVTMDLIHQVEAMEEKPE